MTTIADLTQAPNVGRKAVILFWAPWHDDSAPGGTMDGVLRTLASATATTSHDDDDSSILFARVQAESCPNLSKQYQVTAVPTFVLLDEKGNVFEKIEGNEDVSNVTLAVQRLAAAPGSNSMAPEKTTHESDALTKRLDRLIRSSPVMLFMKGTPTAPKCGFSRQAVALLQDNDIPFGSFDILSDDAVRQGLKKHSNWPTYPQLYVNGTLVGGLDILQEMAEDDSSSLNEQLGLSESIMQQQQPEESLNDRLNKLVRRHKVMLFMKGLPSAPRCGFSRQMCDILNEQGVSFDAYNILEDEEVRQGLKTFSSWPTYPQLYVDGNLIGGLDIVKEMKEDGSLKEALLGG